MMTVEMRINNLNDLRRYKNYGLREVADRMGITKSYLSYIEKGKRNLTPELAAKLADVYDLDVETIKQLYWNS